MTALAIHEGGAAIAPDPEHPLIPDVYRWANEQAAHLRARRFDLVDIANVADEMETVARSEFKSLASHIEIVLAHLLKWDHQPAKRTRSWIASIEEHRSRIQDDLADSPSLKRRLEDAVARAFKHARRTASRETELVIDTFQETCPYSWNDIIERPFVLDRE